MTDAVLCEVTGHVATITLNRPEAYNSLNYEAYEMLSWCFADADADPEVRAIICTAHGRGFCTGDDVKELLGAGAEELARRIRAGELEDAGRYAMAYPDRRSMEDLSALPEPWQFAPSWTGNYMFARAQTIYGGSTEVQKNIIWRSLGRRQR